MPAFSSFDTRGYPTVSAREGYALWSPSYEATVKEDMDTWLLEQVRTVAWSGVRRAADLGCGTGRTGSWLKEHGVQRIDGIDLTPEMLEKARARGVFASLSVADVGSSGLEGEAYDLITTSLVDEHLKDL
ncbi:MAG TPA: class I SAM-dependent methyltransferase, partial [Myxococcaceae bacterium]